MTKKPFDVLKYDPKNVKNDSGLSLEEVQKALQGDNSVRLTYGDISILIERTAYEEVRANVKKYSAFELPLVKESTLRSLQEALPAVKSLKASKQVMDDFVSDLMIWEALKSTSN